MKILHVVGARPNFMKVAPVWEQLRTVYDPEIPINVVELGLIYDCHLERPAGSTGDLRKAVVK